MSGLLSPWYLPILVELPFVAFVGYFYFKWPTHRVVAFSRRAKQVVSTLCVLVCVGLLISTTAALAEEPSRASIEQGIDRLVDLLSDGIAVADPEFRVIKFGKIFGSNREDAIAFFNVEGFHGTNLHREYLAFFEAVAPDQVAGRRTHPYRLVTFTQIGGRSWRSFDPKTAQLGSRSVRVSGHKWRPSDPGCCPSEPVTVTFRVANGGIMEVGR